MDLSISATRCALNAPVSAAMTGAAARAIAVAASQR
jgi:hypothetical protein